MDLIHGEIKTIRKVMNTEIFYILNMVHLLHINLSHEDNIIITNLISPAGYYRRNQVLT